MCLAHLLCQRSDHSHNSLKALLNPKTSILIHHHPHTGNLNRETSGDSKNAFLTLWRCFSSPELMMGSKRRRMVSIPGGSRLCPLFSVLMLPWSLAATRDSTVLDWPSRDPRDSSCSRAASLLACSVCWCCSWTTRVLSCFRLKACALKALSRSATKLCMTEACM